MRRREPLYPSHASGGVSAAFALNTATDERVLATQYQNRASTSRSAAHSAEDAPSPLALMLQRMFNSLLRIGLWIFTVIGSVFGVSLRLIAYLLFEYREERAVLEAHRATHDVCNDGERRIQMMKTQPDACARADAAMQYYHDPMWYTALKVTYDSTFWWLVASMLLTLVWYVARPIVRELALFRMLYTRIREQQPRGQRHWFVRDAAHACALVWDANKTKRGMRTARKADALLPPATLGREASSVTVEHASDSDRESTADSDDVNYTDFMD